jgi:CRP-like cAMP-binding protein
MSGAAQSGIITRVYKSGSIIYFEGDKSEYIYILKGGRAVLTSLKLDTGEEIKEDVRHGEFFGVKSALGKYPREETAQTIGETTVLVLTMADFERLVLRNVAVVQKMLRVFSNQLRRIHKMVRSVLGETDEIDTDVELFRIGEHYYKERTFDKAQYAFKKYMEYYPDSQYADIAMQRIKAVDSGMADSGDAGVDMGSTFSAPSAPSDSFGDALDDFSFDDGETSSVPGAESDLTSELGDFLSDDTSSDLDDSSIIEELYKNGLQSMDEKDYSSALEKFNKIINEENDSGPDKDKFMDAHVQIGICYVGMKDMKTAMKYFSDTVNTYGGTSAAKKAVFNIAGVFEKVGQSAKAKAYYEKVLSMSPADELNQQAEMKLQSL